MGAFLSFKSMVHLRSYFLAFLVMCAFISCENQEKTEYSPNWEEARNYYLQNMNEAISGLEKMSKNKVDDSINKTLFISIREAFKKAEPYASYLNPEVGHRANGPALPIYKEDNGRFINPIGLQKIEETLYEGGVDQTSYDYEIDITKGFLKVLKNDIEKRELTPQRFFIATHQQLLRIISFSMANFDTPVSGLGIKEAAVSLNSLKEVYKRTIQFLIRDKNSQLDETFLKQVDDAVAYIQNNTSDFEDFDRFSFIRDYVNPITRSWVEIRKESGLWEGADNFPFNFDAPTFFEPNSFNLDFFTPAVNSKPTPEQIALGKKLFFDPNLSEAGKMACATCHTPEKAYSDGLVTSLDN